MIVPDSSAWVEFFRSTGSSVHLTVRRLLSERAELATTEVVIFELLAGCRSSQEQTALRARFAAFPVLVLGGLAGFEAAAELYRTCRAGGETLRGLLDCLVAAPVIRANATLLAADRDFEALARHSPLRLEPVAE